MQDMIWYILYTYIYLQNDGMFVSIVIFSIPNQTCFFLCAFPTHWNWKVDQVLDEEHGEKWEVLRQSLRAVLHRTSWTRLVEFVGVVVIIWLLVHMTSMWCPHDFCLIMWHDICDVHILVLIIIIIYYHRVIWYSYLSLRSHGTRRNFRLILPNVRPNEGLFQIVWSWPRWYLSSWWAWLLRMFFFGQAWQKIVQSLFKCPSSLFSGRIKLIYVKQGVHQLLL